MIEHGYTINSLSSGIDMLSPKYNRGFTLAELMVAAGVLGIFSLAVLHLITNMTKSKDDFQSRVDQLSARVGVERVLADYNLCATSLLGENGKKIKLDQIYQEIIPDSEHPETELNKKYIISSIQPFHEPLLEAGKTFSGITVGRMSLNKMLKGSNPLRKRFRLNLNVPLLDSKSKELKKSLNWPIEVKVDTDDKNLIVKCQLHFLDMPHYDNSHIECVNWGLDSRVMDTGLCPRGTQGGFSVTKISPSGDK
ncbi:MAG: prepilin-type N-terminal cleavage/methylation domain-containing protein, partial [Bdellovibrionota bacterium]